MWQNPREISNYTDTHGHIAYDPDNHDYPLSTSMLDLIKTQMIATNLQPLIQSGTDLSNNAKSDVQPNTQK